MQVSKISIKTHMYFEQIFSPGLTVFLSDQYKIDSLVSVKFLQLVVHLFTYTKIMVTV